jgi:hypothetical protein
MAFLEANSLVVFYYLSAIDILPNKRGGLWLEWLYKRGTIATASNFVDHINNTLYTESDPAFQYVIVICINIFELVLFCNDLKRQLNFKIPKRFSFVHLRFYGIRVMVLNATFSNISVISWRSVLLVEETRVPRENQTCRKSLTNFII